MALEKFLSYFHRELNYLRNAGAVFAAKHPKIARRLDWTKGASNDPHVERLLESFAFLSAQLHQNLDDRFPQISAGLLNVLYPHLINPLPSCAVASFEVDPAKAKMTSGYVIPKKTPLFAYAEENLICRFQTGFDVTLWPIHVTAAVFDEGHAYRIHTSVPKAPWYIKISLKADGVFWSDLELDTLTFHLAGDRLTATKLYQGIFGQQNLTLLYSRDGKNLYPLPVNALHAVGFEQDEQLLPSSSHSHPSYRLLQEYFHFPEKYFFFQIRHLLAASKSNASDDLEIWIPLRDSKVVNTLSITPQNFLLGCTPIINLFEKTTDPLRLTERQVEYRLPADERLERTHEIHSIQEVYSVHDDGSIETYAPYYSFEHGQDTSLFWHSRRVASDKRDIPGTDVYLSFVNHQFDATQPPHETIFAKAFCTNRFLAEQLPAGAILHYDGKLPVTKMTCLEKPITPCYSPMDGETLWKLVSQLSLHHLGQGDNETALKMMKETLNLYANSVETHSGSQIASIETIAIKSVVRRIAKRINDQAWKGFVEGLNIALTLDEEIDPSGMNFILSHVLYHYLRMNVHINSFIEMTVLSNQRQEEWVTWSPLLGHLRLL